MEIAYKYIFNIVDGVGKIQGRKQFEADISQLGNCKMVMTLKRYRKTRTNKQNAVLHWYINEIADETGMAPDSIKEVLRHKFLSVDAIDRNGEIMADKVSGEVLKAYRSTADLTTTEFNEFTENVRLWANDFLNLQLPLPNEETELKFK